LEVNFADILAVAEERSFLRGKPVQVTYGKQVVHGIATRLDAEGALVLKTPEGSEVVISSGEATINR
jgi:biotin-(acetyl-CoA carboxylase) ligase